jgi:hypothetical protein
MTRTGRLVVALGLALSAGIATGCVARGSGYVGVQTTPVVYQEPPAPQVETHVSRPGSIWVRGRWDWQNGQWQWVDGRWETDRAGYAWSDGRWERRGNSWHWIEGTWSASANVNVNNGGNPNGWQPNTQGPANGGAPPATGGGMYPTVAPPPVRVENYGAAKPNYIWVAGRWDWRAGNWAWVDGHWERERANMQWIAGRWELQGNYYVWVEGRWDRAGTPPPTGPVIRDHR